MDYIDDNKKWWNNVVEDHIHSEFYDNASFIKGRSSINEIELPYLADIQGKKVLHIQCHFGQDTISLKRMGAASVTGTDISDIAIEKARALAMECGQECRFVCCNTWDLESCTDTDYDLVFLSYGVITWLDDLDRLAKIIHTRLKSGGQVLMAEFHPTLMMYEFSDHTVSFPYFNTGMMSEEREGSYASDQAEKNVHHFWSHPLEEILMSFKNNGYMLEEFREFDFSPYACFENMEEVDKGRFVYGSLDIRLPHVFVYKAKKV